MSEREAKPTSTTIGGIVGLDDFVTDTILQILRGVLAAQEGNPIKTAAIGNSSNLLSMSDIEFDVAVTATQGSDKKVHVGVVAAMVGAGVAAGNQAEATTQSRIKFSIPVHFE